MSEKKCTETTLAVSMVKDAPDIPVKCEIKGEHTEHKFRNQTWKSPKKTI